MTALKYTLIGLIGCMVLEDIVRTHLRVRELTSESTTLHAELSSLLETATKAIHTSDTCLTTLDECRYLHASSVESQKLQTMTRIQILSIIKQAENGSEDAQAKLEELGSAVKNKHVTKAMDQDP